MTNRITRGKNTRKYIKKYTHYIKRNVVVVVVVVAANIIT